jgi:hypothetical protein
MAVRHLGALIQAEIGDDAMRSGPQIARIDAWFTVPYLNGAFYSSIVMRLRQARDRWSGVCPTNP